MSPELARRVKQRPSLRRPMTRDEQVEIIADWLSGAGISALARSHRRSKRTIQRIIHEAEDEAARVLERDG